MIFLLLIFAFVALAGGLTLYESTLEPPRAKVDPEDWR